MIKFLRYLLAYFNHCNPMAQIDDLNAAIANLNDKNNALITAQQNLDVAVAGVESRASNIPVGPDLSAATAAVIAAANSLVGTQQALEADITRLNAVLPPTP